MAMRVPVAMGMGLKVTLIVLLLPGGKSPVPPVAAKSCGLAPVMLTSVTV